MILIRSFIECHGINTSKTLCKSAMVLFFGATEVWSQRMAEMSSMLDKEREKNDVKNKRKNEMWSLFICVWHTRQDRIVWHVCAFFNFIADISDPREPKIRLKRTERLKNKLFSPTICLQQTIEQHKDNSTYLSMYMIGAVEDLSLIQCPKKYIWTLKPH